MANTKKIETFERDNLIVSIIFQRQGKENAISIRDLATALNEKGYTVRENAVHYIVKNIIFERHLPICSLIGYGYWWGEQGKMFKRLLMGCKAKLMDCKNALIY